MGDEIDIIGPLTEQQKRDTLDVREIRRNTKWHQAIKAFEKREAELTKELHKPFCYHCAKTEYEAAQKDIFKRADSKVRYGQQLKNDGFAWIERNMPVKVNLAPYEDAKRFRSLKPDKITESTKVNGQRITYVTTFENYQCTVRGCKLSIQVREELDGAESREETKKRK